MMYGLVNGLVIGLAMGVLLGFRLPRILQERLLGPRRMWQRDREIVRILRKRRTYSLKNQQRR